QSVALALGGLAVFALATHRLGDERPAAMFAVLYLLHPSLHGINVRDFHSAALAIPLLLAAIYFAEAGRPWLFAIAVLLTLATREDAAIAVVGLGLWLALTRRRWVLGGVTTAGALALLIADTRWIIPYFRGAPYPHLGRFADLGHSVPEILETLVLHPWRVPAAVVPPDALVRHRPLPAPRAVLPLVVPAPLGRVAPALAAHPLRPGS